MPYPSVTPLPHAASRIGDPDNFAGEADLFLSRFADWRTQSNSLATYINAAPLNIWNWGFIGETNPSYVDLTPIAARPSQPGAAWANAQDSLWASLEFVSYEQNAVGEFVDAIGALTGSATDPDRPLTSLMATAPARGQQQSTFNTNSAGFYDSVAIYTDNLNTVSQYFNQAITPEDWGTVDVASLITIDWGTL